jgi:putative salt-induced outer membrane protein YdiY
MRRAFILVLLSLSLSAALVRADQVTLKNGDRLSGAIVKTDDDKKTLEIKTELAGDVTLQWDAVTAIVSSQPLHLTLSDGRVVTGTVTTTDGKLSVATKDAGEVSTERAAVKAIRNDQEQAEFDQLQHPRLRDYWSGLFDLGLSVTEGNSATSALSIASKAARVVPKDKLSLYYTQVYAKDSNRDPAVTTANAIHAGIRYEFNLNPKVYVFAFTDFDSDALQNLDLRNVLGGGLGYHFIHSKNTQLDVFGGASFNQEYFSTYLTTNPLPPPAEILVPSESRHSAEVLAGESLSTKLGSRTTITEQLTFFPNVSNLGEYRINFDAGATTKLNSWLGWQITFSDRYISNPPLNLKGNDLLLSTGLRLTFGRGIF